MPGSTAEPNDTSSNRSNAPMPGSIFDLPHAYESFFGSETDAEARFVEDCLDSSRSRPVQRLFEPGCGGGRLLKWFADRGYDVAGVEQSPAAATHANQLLDSVDSLPEPPFYPRVATGDMTTFELHTFKATEPFDAAFCSVNTVRHLPSDGAVLKHLESMASVIRPKGRYVIDIELNDAVAWTPDTETLSGIDADRVVEAVIWRKKLEGRTETLGTLVKIQSNESDLRQIEGEIAYRTYSRRQASTLFNSSASWSVVDERAVLGTASDRWTNERLAYVLQRC